MSLETSAEDSKKVEGETPEYLKEDDSAVDLAPTTVRTAPHSYSIPKSQDRRETKILEFQDFKAPFTSTPRASRPSPGKKLS